MSALETLQELIPFTAEQQKNLEVQQFHQLRIKRLQEVRDLEKQLSRERRAKYNQELVTAWELIVEQLRNEWAQQNVERLAILSESFEKIKQSIGKAHRDARQLNAGKPSSESLLAYLNEQLRLVRLRNNEAVASLRLENQAHQLKIQEHWNRINESREKAIEKERREAKEYRLAHPEPPKPRKVESPEPEQRGDDRVLGGVPFEKTQKFAGTRYHQGYLVTAGDERQNDAIVMAARLSKVKGILTEKKQQIDQTRRKETEKRFDKAIKVVHSEKEHEKMLKKLSKMQVQDRKRRQLNINPTPAFGQPKRQSKLDEIFSKTFVSAESAKAPKFGQKLTQKAFDQSNEKSVEFTTNGQIVLLKPT